MEQLTIRHNTVNYGMQLACAYATKDSHISKQRSGMRGNHESYRENI
jgi:hypothetical protein